MKKVYSHLFSLLFTLILVSQSISATDQPVFKVRGFAPSDWSSPKTLSNGKSNITVSFMRYTFEQGSNLWVDGSMYSSIDYIRLNDSSNEANGTNIESNINYSSYILFEIPSGYPAITKIELIGYSFGAGNFYDTSNLIEAYSKTDNTVSAFQLNNPTDTSVPWGTEYYVNGPAEDIVGNGNSVTHVVGRYDATYTGVDPIPANTEEELSQIRYIRINWSSAEFGSVSSAMGRGRPLALFGLNIYTNEKDDPTGLDEYSEESYKIGFTNNEVYVSEKSVITVYDLSGKQVLLATGATILDISSLSKGVYLVKAQSKAGGKTCVEKILKK